MEMSLRFAFMLVTTPTACGIALWRPFWGLICLVFLYYFRPEVWNAPTWFRPIFWITVAVAVGWATRERVFRWHPLMSLSIAVLIGHLASSMTAVDDPNRALDCTITLSKLIVVQFLAIQLVDTPKKVSLYLWANVLGMIWNTKTVLYLGLTGAGVTEDMRVDVGVGQGGGANYLAMIFVMFLPILIMKFQNGSRRERTLSIMLLPLMTLCVVFTGSRSGFIGVGAVMLHQLFRSNRKVLGFVSIVVMAVVGYLFTPDSHWDRFQQGVGTEDKRRDFAAQSRLLLWKAGMQMWRDYPILGVGPDNFTSLSPQYAGFYAGREAERYTPGVKKAGMVAHNTWVQTLAEGGIISAFPFLMMFFLVFYYLRKSRRIVPKHWPEYREFYLNSVIIEGMFIAFVVCAFFGSYIKIDFLWWHMGVVSALVLMAESRVNFVYDSIRKAKLRAQLEVRPQARATVPERI